MKQQEVKKVICDDRGCRVVQQQPIRQLYQLPDGSLGDRADVSAYDRK